MSTVAEEVEAPPAPTSEVIMQPAKSEDKLEIEREEKEKEEEKGNDDGKDGKDAEGAEDEKKDEEVSYVPLLAICAPFYLGFPRNKQIHLPNMQFPVDHSVVLSQLCI